jgi:enamine deaminase RidA (YjgF/YER057c/UK114 family)
VSGTTSIDPSNSSVEGLSVLHPTSAYHQTRAIFDEIIKVVERLDGRRSDIVRVRMFVVSDEDVEDVGRALKDVFGDIRPTAWMVIGLRLVAPELKVEVEADAIVLWCVLSIRTVYFYVPLRLTSQPKM